LLILDASGSMWGRVGGEEKIVVARRVLRDLASKLPDQSQVGLIAYGHRREADCADIETIVPLGPLNRADLTARVDKLNPKGKTPITQSIDQAVAAVRKRSDPTTIILLSDGIETCTGDPCAAVRQAKQSGANFLLHVIGFDLSKENVAQLECAAQAGGGLYFSAENAADLSAALNQAVAVNESAADSALSVKAVLNGSLTDVSVAVTDAKTGKQVAVGRTYTSPETNPRRLPLPAGTYNIAVHAVRIRGDIQQTFSGVVVAKGATVEKVADFSTGELSVTVLRNGALSDASVSVTLAGTKTRAAGGRTYTAATSNPSVYQLTPGTYDVEIGSVEIANRPTHRFTGIVVKPEERVAVEHEYQSGILLVGAKNGGALVDATVGVYPAGEKQAAASGRTYTAANSNPQSFVLQPGKYRVVLKPVRPAGAATKEFEIVVAAGQSVERVVDFAQ
jgi:Ca-activated chloride channel family protein